MTAELLALLDSDPAAGILAVSDLRQRRVNAATQGTWETFRMPPSDDGIVPEVVMVRVMRGPRSWDRVASGACDPAADTYYGAEHYLMVDDAEHIAAEANPAHALAAVRRWRGVVERHVRSIAQLDPPYGFCRECQARWAPPGATTAWPCPEIRETADEARAYLGGAP